MCRHRCSSALDNHSHWSMPMLSVFLWFTDRILQLQCYCTSLSANIESYSCYCCCCVVLHVVHIPLGDRLMCFMGGFFFFLSKSCIYFSWLLSITRIRRRLYLLWFRPSSQFTSVFVGLKCHSIFFFPLSRAAFLDYAGELQAFKAIVVIMFKIKIKRLQEIKKKRLWQLDEGHWLSKLSN